MNLRLPNRDEVELKMQMAADRVLSAIAAITPQRQGKAFMWASVVLSVAAIIKPEFLSPDLLKLRDLLNVGAISDLVKKVAKEGDELSDKEITQQMQALLPLDDLERLLIGHKDLLRNLTRQHEWQQQIQRLLAKDQEMIVHLLAEFGTVTGDLVTIQDMLAGIEGLLSHVVSMMPTNVIKVPVVVAAMSQAQAQDLVSKIEEPELALLSTYREYARMEVDEWISHYNNGPDEWVPFFRLNGEKETIREIVSDIIADFNAKRTNGKEQFLLPNFISLDFFTSSDRSRIWGDLVSQGGILIIDPLSLQHSAILNALMQSQVLGNKSISTIVINPLDMSFIEIHLQVQRMVEMKLEVFYSRFFNTLELECEFGGSDIIKLRRWLSHRLENIKQEWTTSSMPSKARSIFTHSLEQSGIKPNPSGSQFGDLIRQA